MTTIVSSKICPKCGVTFVKRKKCGYKQWESQICCSNKCGKIMIYPPGYPDAKAKELLARTIITPNGCMEFKGYISSNGYVHANVFGKFDHVHRHIYRLVKGEIPEKADVCHTCDNRKCINPDHLFVGTRLDNMRDMIDKGRQVHPATMTAESTERLLEMAKNGISYKDMEKEFGIKKERIGKIAIANGIRRRPRYKCVASTSMRMFG